MRKQLLKNLCMAFLGVTGMSYAANAQHWLATISGPVSTFTNEYKGNHLAVDSEGNTYSTGTYGSSGTGANRWISAWSHGETDENGTAAFTVNNAGTTSARHNSFIAKTNGDGGFEWMLGLGSSATTATDITTTNTIAVDEIDGAVYVGGFFSGKIDYFSDPLYSGEPIAASSGEDGLLIKLTKSGKYTWHKVFSDAGTSNERVKGVTTDHLGNVIVVGIYSGKLKINGNEVLSSLAKGDNDMFVAKFDKEGTLLFIKSMGGAATSTTQVVDDIWGVATDLDNSIYVSGSVGFGTAGAPKEVYIDTQLLPQGLGTDSYLAKFDASLNIIWAKVVLSDVNHQQVAHSIVVDNDNVAGNRGVYITGFVGGKASTINIDFGGVSITPTNTATSPYVAKFNAGNGNGIWAQIFDSGATCYGYVIAVNSNKELYAGGYAQTSIKFGDEVIPAVGSDGYIVKLNPDNGTVIDKKMIVSSGNTNGTDRVCGLVVTNSSVYANGIAAGGGASTPYTTTNFAGTGADYYYRGGSWNTFIMKWGSTSLPVSLTEFKGSRTSMGNLLSWKTLSETNNEYFEVERSADGINFSPIKKLTGSGTSTTKINYNYLDTNPLNGINYYRLKQVDINGTFSYSKETVAIDNLLQMDGLKLYPNPGSGIVNVQLPSFSADTEINVYSQTGKLVEFYTNVSGNNQVIDISKQPIGVYYIQVIEKGKSNLIKYLKQ